MPKNASVGPSIAQPSACEKLGSLGRPSSSESGPRALCSTACLTLAAGSFFRKPFASSITKTSIEQGAEAGVHFMEADQLNKE